MYSPLMAVERVINDQSQIVADLLQYLDDEQLVWLAHSLATGEPVAIGYPAIERAIDVMAGMTLAREFRRRLEVAELESFGD